MKHFFTFLFMAVSAISGYAEWPADPSVNLAVGNRTGEQTLPKIVATSGGGCYVAWQDHSSGNYDTYLQRYDGVGNPQWVHNGVLVSHHPQDTWITDYDMTVDRDDFAIVVINDIRAGSDRDIYAYRVSPAGEFVWGTDGFTVSNNDGFEPDPRVIQTSGGNFVIAWQEETAAGNVVNLRKLTGAGIDVWAPPIVTVTGPPYGLSIPRIAPALNDEVIVQYLKHRGSQIYSPRHLFAQKLDSLGARMWADTGVVISSAGGIGIQMKPELISDAVGGAFSYWYDSHDANRHHAYVQHVLWDGSMAWTANGVQASLAAGELQMSPSLARIPEGSGVIIFYMTANTDQSLWGVGGQMISMAGARVWGDNAREFVPLGQQQRFLVSAQPQEDGACAAYLEFVQGSAVHSQVKVFRVNSLGDFVWPDSPRDLCSVTSEKGKLATTANSEGMVTAAWMDKRVDSSGDIYLQNIHADGTYGVPNLPPRDFSLSAPADGDTLLDYETLFLWTQSWDPDGDPLRYNLHLRVYWGPGFEQTIPVPTDTIITLTWEQITGQPEHDWVPVDWWVEVIAGVDTVRSNQEWHFVIPQQGAAEEPEFLPVTHELLTAYPNPFNAQTELQFTLTRSGNVNLSIVDLLGRQVANLLNQSLSVGVHRVAWTPDGLVSGLYFVRLDERDIHTVRKLVLLR